VTVRDKLRSISQRRTVHYALSLPERAVRSVAAVTAGLARELSDLALPLGVRRGRLYRNLVELTLQFLIEEVGQVEGARASEQRLGENFLLRRAAGNGIELMGILAFRASPVWVLAALADVCGLGRQIIPQVAEALREEGLLEPGGSFSTMEQLLQGLERSSAQLAETVNTPPLDVAGLRQEWAKLVAEARQLPAPKMPSPSAVTRLWSDLRTEAQRQRRSVFEVSSVLAIAAVRELPERVRVLSKSAAIALNRGGAILSAGLLDHYRGSLAEIRRAGYLRYGVRQITPYARAARGAFALERKTLTSKLLDRL
jgi:hypothetical protein